MTNETDGGISVSIIIPAYNAADTIEETLEACLGQDFPEDEYEVIVVDDGSTDRTWEVVAGYPVEYIHQENAGRGAALNTGVATAAGELLVFLDADCIAPSDWLGRIVNVCLSETDIGIVGVIYAPASGLPLVSSAINEEIRFRHVRMPEYTTHIGGFCTAMPRSVFEQVGGYDEQFRRAQDNEMSYRVAEQGYRLRVVKDVGVMHNHTRSFRSWLKNQYYQAYWRVQSFGRHQGMLGSGGYTGLRDWLSPALALGVIVLAPFIWLPIVPWVELGLFAALAALHVPVAAFAIGDTGDWRHGVLIPMQIMRSFAWAAGAIIGAANSWHVRERT